MCSPACSRVIPLWARSRRSCAPTSIRRTVGPPACCASVTACPQPRIGSAHSLPLHAKQGTQFGRLGLRGRRVSAIRIGMGAPRGTYTFWRWPAWADGAASLAWDLTVLRDPGPTTYFWAHQFSFERGDVGYFGLQAHDRRDDGSHGRLAVFSIWS